MRIILFSRPQIGHTAEEVAQIFEALRASGCDYAINEEFAPTAERLTGIAIPSEKIYGATVGHQEEDAVMVCYGGDGTLLEGVQRLGGERLHVMGINAGHLGFLTTAPKADVKELTDLFTQLSRGELTVERRSMLQLGGDLPENMGNNLALNEFTIQRNGAGMISVETYVNDQMVATYHGDGVIVTTPTGSTAYSLSAGGPVVAPTCACMVISPLAPHNLTMRPVVIPDSATIRMKVHAERSEAFITLDNRSYPVAGGSGFTVSRAAEPIFLVVPHNISFYDTLRNKMMWGVDIRS